MRILYVSLDPGIAAGSGVGGAVHIEAMVQAWRADGHEVDLLTRRGNAGPGTTVVPSGAMDRWRGPVAGELGAVLSGPRLARCVEAAITRHRPDLVYERYALFRSEIGEVARRRGIPHVLEVNAPLAEEARRFRHHRLTRLAARKEAQAWRGAGLVVTVTGSLARRARACGAGRVLVAGNGVDAVPGVSEASTRELRGRLGLEGRFVVGFVGSMMPWHDLPTLVGAVRIMADRVPATLLLVGDGPASRSTLQLADALDVPVSFVGRVPHEQVPAHLAAMDVCVSSLVSDPALDYFSPLKAMEYLAAGRPTVVTDAAGLAELVAAGAALGYPAGDKEALADRLSGLASDAGLSERLAAAGRAYAAGHSWQAISQRILAAAGFAAPVATAGRSE